MSKYNLENFIEKASDIHNNKYEYNLVEWKNVGTKVTIVCKEHGNFEQTPSNHLMGKKCSYCSGVGRLTKNIFLERALKVHNNKYEYILDNNNITNTKKIKIKCKTHGIFNQTPKNHLKGQECPKCSNYYKYNQKEFIEKCIKVHGEKYDYTNIKYIKNSVNVKILCKIHGEFEQLPLNHLKGNGCYKCAGKSRTTADFIEKANKIHGKLFDYSKVEYSKSRKHVIIICKTHGDFSQHPNDHLNGCGCNKCNVHTYSKVCLRWLAQIENKLGYKLQHAENMGEKQVRINGKLMKFDGYDEKTNTVYEFFGSMWHGDPRLYKADDFNPVSKKSYGELYNETKKREEIIKSQGYNLVVIWEKDFK